MGAQRFSVTTIRSVETFSCYHCQIYRPPLNGILFRIAFMVFLIFILIPLTTFALANVSDTNPHYLDVQSFSRQIFLFAFRHFFKNRKFRAKKIRSIFAWERAFRLFDANDGGIIDWAVLKWQADACLCASLRLQLNHMLFSNGSTKVLCVFLISQRN